MDEQPTLSRDDGNRIFQHVISSFDAPAYVRRARRVQQALDALLCDCRRRRDDWLTMVVVRLWTLRGLAASWERLTPWLADTEEVDRLARLWEELQPDLQVRIEPTTSERRLRRALDALVAEIETFNRRWTAYLPTVERDEVNRQRDGYNRYYVLEKECAVRSSAVARQGFQPLETLTTAELLRSLPLLDAPRTNPGERGT